MSGEISLPLHEMPMCLKFKRFGPFKNVFGQQNNSTTTSLFEQKRLKGWWPLYEISEGIETLAVSQLVVSWSVEN